MTRWKYALFDLDGTITDSAPSITKAIQHTLSEFGHPEAAPEEVRKYLGPPLWVSFRDYLGLEGDELTRAVEVYRAFYKPISLTENRLFPGITEAIAKLQSHGVRLAIATSKVDKQAEEIVEWFSLGSYFEVISGSDYEGVLRGTKAAVVGHALGQLGAPKSTSVIMIGDREHDVHGARQHGVQTIGVRWGYAGPGELEQAGADFYADTPDELVQVVLDATVN